MRRLVSPPFLSALAFGLLTIPLGPTWAAEHVVNMLNTGKDGAMAFEPSYIKAAVGDTVVFKPTQKGGHNSAAVLTPVGADKWKSSPDAEHKVKLTKEGVYLYVCEPHKSMGMVGAIQVGKPINLADAKTLSEKESKAMAMGKDRWAKALAQVN